LFSAPIPEITPGYRPGFLPNKKLRGIAGARIFFQVGCHSYHRTDSVTALEQADATDVTRVRAIYSAGAQENHNFFQFRDVFDSIAALYYLILSYLLWIH